MSSVSATEIELMAFFEIQPVLRCSNDPWIYNDALYEFSQEEWSLSFSIMPSYRDVHIILTRNGERTYELNAIGLKDVIYLNDGGRESLKLVINETEFLLLRIKPRISILHQLKND